MRMRFGALAVVAGVLLVAGCGSDVEPEIPLPEGSSETSVSAVPGDAGGSDDGGELGSALTSLMAEAGCEGKLRDEPEEPAGAHARCLMGGELPVDVAVFSSAGDRDAWVAKYGAVGVVESGDEPVLWAAAGLDAAGPEAFAGAVK